MTSTDPRPLRYQLSTTLCQTFYIAGFTADLTKVLDDWFASSKRELAEDNSSSIYSVAKTIRLESHELKSKSKQQQYEHQLNLIEHMEGAQRAL